MNTNTNTPLLAIVAAALLGLVCNDNPLRADDTELYTGALQGGFEQDIRPNILYILDTSGSMRESAGFFIDPKEYWDGPYDPTTSYTGACSGMMYYYSELSSSEVEPGTDKAWVSEHGYPLKDPEGIEVSLPDCNDNYFSKFANSCGALADASQTGWYDDYFGSYWPIGDAIDGDSMDGKWHDHLKGAHNNIAAYGPTTKMLYRECSADFGVHGALDTLPKKYPNKGDDSADNPWTSSPADAYDGHRDNNHYIVASGNFLNWFYAAGQNRMTAVKIAMRDIIKDLPAEANVGIMRFDSGTNPSATETDGGMMIHEFVNVGVGTGAGSNRQSLIDTVMSISDDTAGGTPLGETMLEALYVFSGGPVYSGNKSYREDETPLPSVTASRKSATPTDAEYKYYKTPITATCQQNTVVYLTDGSAASDSAADDGYGAAYDASLGVDGTATAGWQSWTGGEFRGGLSYLPNADNYLYGDSSFDACNSPGFACLPKITGWLANEDVNPDVAGNQHVFTNTIGFTPAEADEDPDTLPDPDFLQEAANNGKGEFFAVTSFEELREAFKVLTRKAVSANTAFTAPALAINAFNRTRDLDDIYYALFKTSLNPGWEGNLKKFRFKQVSTPDGGTAVIIADARGEPAVVPATGLFAHDSLSIWSTPPMPDGAPGDGNNAAFGGAASNLPTGRNLYTFLPDSTGTEIIVPENAFAAYNADQYEYADFGMDGSESYTRADLINWLSGLDMRDEDGDTIKTESRFHMGDPLHSRPVVVTYGAAEDNPDHKIFLTTNDGMLHVIDADTGIETFGFIAFETLTTAKRNFENDSSDGKIYGLDGAPLLWIDEGSVDKPGINVAGDVDDKVYLYVGMRRGGKNYYAFDMTEMGDAGTGTPKLLWKIKGGDLDGDTDMDAPGEDFFHLGMTFSTPQLGELKISGTAQKVLIFGGGYDPVQDGPAGTTNDVYVEAAGGAAVYIVDAKTGARLWWANADSTASLTINDMKNSIPADISVIDADFDGWTDRIYFGDIGGRIFRVDIDEENPDGTINATGGMIADIGASDVADNPTTSGINEQVRSNRKIFYAVDVVTVEESDSSYLALAFGTGNRAAPAGPYQEQDTAVQDAFFVIKDPHVLSPPASYAYGITMDPTDLYDATANLVMSDTATVREQAEEDMADAKGWYIRMEHEGEKVLAESVTFNYRTMFTSFEPLELDLENCQARTGIGRLYTVDLRNGKPVIPEYSVNDGETGDELTTEDRAYVLKRDGIPPAVMISFPDANNGEPLPTVATESPPGDAGSNIKRSYWHGN